MKWNCIYIDQIFDRSHEGKKDINKCIWQRKYIEFHHIKWMYVRPFVHSYIQNYMPDTQQFFFIRHDDRAEKIFNFNLLIAACKVRRNLPFCLITLMSVCKGSCTGLTWKVGPISHAPHWCCWWYDETVIISLELLLLLNKHFHYFCTDQIFFYQQKKFWSCLNLVYLLCTHLNDTAQHRYVWNFCCVWCF